MIDQIGAISVTAVFAAFVGVLVGLSSMEARQKRKVVVAAAAWGAVIVAIAALGGFAPGAAGPLPTPIVAVIALLVVLFGSWFFVPAFRFALLSVPLPVLIALNASRLGGLYFLILYAEGRLSAPFATSAGWGDIATGALAIPLALMAWRDPEHVRMPVALWNAFGVLDLVAALTLGALSAPGTPIRVFTEGPGTLVMGQLPWAMVPALLVPLYLLMHLTIAAKVRSPQRLPAAVAAG